LSFVFSLMLKFFVFFNKDAERTILITGMESFERVVGFDCWGLFGIVFLLDEFMLRGFRGRGCFLVLDEYFVGGGGLFAWDGLEGVILRIDLAKGVRIGVLEGFV
jgi:hypothetical protein